MDKSQVRRSRQAPLTGIRWGRNEIMPRSQAVELSWPGLPVVFIYQRPHSVLVRGKDGAEQRLAVLDITRRLQWLIGIYTLVSIAIMWLLSARMRAN